MNQSSPNLVHVRPSVESLESRELPSVSLTSLHSLAYQPSAAQVRYLSPTSWRPGYSGLYPGVGTTPSIIGVLVSL